MSRAEKTKPLPIDHEQVAAEERRREELAGSGSYQRGVAAAKAQQITNDRSALNTELANLKRATATRDANVPGRDKYDRTYNRVVASAQRLALSTNQSVSGIPAWLAPPVLKEENSITIEVPKPAPTPVVKPTGRGSGVVPGFPGSDAHQAWLNIQGVSDAKR